MLSVEWACIRFLQFTIPVKHIHRVRHPLILLPLQWSPNGFYSRYIVGCQVHARESGELAKEFIAQVFASDQIPKVVHADRGTSMTSKPVAALLADRDVLRSHSRPKVSNDNPYSEAWFKTLKYLPVFPGQFGSLADARDFMDRFVQAYNGHHRTSGIGFHRPADADFGMTGQVEDQRLAALQAAWAAYPERFG